VNITTPALLLKDTKAAVKPSLLSVVFKMMALTPPILTYIIVPGLAQSLT
jgi:hypothetical protein